MHMSSCVLMRQVGEVPRELGLTTNYSFSDGASDTADVVAS